MRASARAWRRADAILARATPFGDVVLGPNAVDPIQLEAMTSLVWEVLATPRTDAELVAEVAARIESDPDELATVVASHRDALVEAGVVVRSS
jgi:hypothetical protein